MATGVVNSAAEGKSVVQPGAQHTKPLRFTVGLTHSSGAERPRSAKVGCELSGGVGEADG